MPRRAGNQHIPAGLGPDLHQDVLLLLTGISADQTPVATNGQESETVAAA